DRTKMNVSKKNVKVDEIQPVTTWEAKNLAKSSGSTSVMPNLINWPAGKAIPEMIQSDIPIQAAKSPTRSARRRSFGVVAASIGLPLPALPTAARTGQANHKTRKIAIGNKVPFTTGTSTCWKKSRCAWLPCAKYFSLNLRFARLNATLGDKPIVTKNQK